MALDIVWISSFRGVVLCMKQKYKYSLGLQLVVILAFLAGITIFSYVFTEKQMQDKISHDIQAGLEKRQEIFLHNVELYDTASPIRSFIYDDRAQAVFVGYTSLESKSIIEHFQAHKQEGIYSFSNQINTYHYLVTKQNDADERYVFTFLIDDFYAQAYEAMERQAALNSVFILMFVTIILVIWILTMVLPLRKLQAEIMHEIPIAIGSKRSDEIGVIRNTIRQYQLRIKQQQHIQEEFIHNVSHDLKTPITVIKSYAEGMEIGLFPHRTLAASAHVISENADRLDEKVSQFLYLNRLDYISENQEMEDIIINQIAKNVIKTMQFQRDDIQFECIERDQFQLYGNEEQWRVYFENIFSNGLRYAKTYIRVTIDADMFTIENDGPKIDNLDALFEKFQKGKGGQTGLGLVIAQKTAHIHDCELVVEQDDYVRFTIQKR